MIAPVTQIRVTPIRHVDAPQSTPLPQHEPNFKARLGRHPRLTDAQKAWLEGMGLYPGVYYWHKKHGLVCTLWHKDTERSGVLKYHIEDDCWAEVGGGIRFDASYEPD